MASKIIVPPMFTVPNVLNVVPSPLNRRPCITAFGTRFPSRFWYPSKVHRYEPLSMPTLQRASAAARAVADVPGAIVAAKHTNAQATARELIIIFVNFVFIVVVSFCLVFVVLAFFGFSLLRSHFWPFTEVVRKIPREVTRKVARWRNFEAHAVASNSRMARRVP